MGLSNPKPKIYFKIKEGNIVITIKADQKASHRELMENAQSWKDTTNTANLPITEINYKQFDGVLKSIALDDNKDSKFGPQWKCVFDSEGTEFIWTIRQDSMLFQSFINSMLSAFPNYGLIRLSPYMDKDGRTWCWVKNDGLDLRWKYTKEEMPQAVPLTTINKKTGEEKPVLNANGEQQYDKSEIIDWIKGQVGIINEALQNKFIAASKYAETPEVVSSDVTDDDDTEVPF